MPKKYTALCRPLALSSAPQLIIGRAEFDEMVRYAVAAGKNEVCGYAFARQLDTEHFWVIPGSVFIVDQHVAPGTARTDPAGEVTVMDYEERFDETDPVYRILWHSHVGGQATFSQTDLKSHDDIGRATALDAMFALVLNNRGQASANLEVYHPFRIGTQVELLVVDDVEEVDLEPYKRAIAKKCQVIPPPPPATYRAPVVAGVVTMGNWDDDPDDDEPLYNPFEEN